MTKLHERTFRRGADDVERDEALAVRCVALGFVRPEHLEIPPGVVDDTHLGRAVEELNKINKYKVCVVGRWVVVSLTGVRSLPHSALAQCTVTLTPVVPVLFCLAAGQAPRDKLVCVLNCCSMINAQLAKSSKEGIGETAVVCDGVGPSTGALTSAAAAVCHMCTQGSQVPDLHVYCCCCSPLDHHLLTSPAGADDFTPLLIFVVIKAATPYLASNLAYIERYRYHPKLTAEAQYYYIQLVSGLGKGVQSAGGKPFLHRLGAHALGKLAVLTQPVAACCPVLCVSVVLPPLLR
jgi:hypothetical protein